MLGHCGLHTGWMLGLSADARQAGAVTTGRVAMLEVAGSLAQAQSCYDVRFGPDFVRLSPSFGHSGQGWECLKLTQSRHSPTDPEALLHHHN